MSRISGSGAENVHNHAPKIDGWRLWTVAMAVVYKGRGRYQLFKNSLNSLDGVVQLNMVQ